MRRATLLMLRVLALAAGVAALADAPGLPRPLSRLRIYVVDASLSVRAAAGERLPVPTVELALDLVRRDVGRLAPDDRFAVVAFDGEIRVFDHEVPLSLPPVAVHRSEAAAALGAALALARPDRVNEIVLFSDGRFEGDVAAVAAGRGIPVLTMPLGAVEPGDARIASVEAPAAAPPGARFEVRVTVASGVDGDAVVRLAGQEQPVRLMRGARHELVFPEATGAESTAELVFPDSCPENNRWPFLVAPADPRPRVLVLGGFTTSPVAALLEREARVERSGALESFDAVVVEELAEPPGALREYVKGGGTLLTLGGGLAYAPWEGSPVEEVLPVWPFPRESVATAIVLDVSGSMADKENWANAKRRVLEATRFLSERDPFVMITFAGTPQVHITGRLDRARLSRALDQVRPGGPTEIVPAVRAAAEALRSADAPRKLIVVITDGVTEEKEQVQRAAFAQIEAEGIPLQAVVTAPTDQLHGLPQIPAAGVDSILEPLRKLFERSKSLVIENPAGSEVLRANRTDPREDAEVLMRVEGAPLLALRRVGRGRSGAYTSALTAEWGGRPEHVARLWERLRPDRAGDPASARFDGRSVRVTWKVSRAPEGPVTWTQGERKGEARLTWRAADRVEAQIVPEGPGRLRIAGPSRLDFEVPYSPELSSLGRDDGPLRLLAERTGGTFNGLDRWQPPARAAAAPGRLFYGIAALLLFVGEALLGVVWK